MCFWSCNVVVVYALGTGLPEGILAWYMCDFTVWPGESEFVPQCKKAQNEKHTRSPWSIVLTYMFLLKKNMNSYSSNKTPNKFEALSLGAHGLCVAND